MHIKIYTATYCIILKLYLFPYQLPSLNLLPEELVKMSSGIPAGALAVSATYGHDYKRFIFSIDMCKSIYIYKIKVLSVHWSKSRHILVAHVSNKFMNENTLNKIPVCLYVCMFPWVQRKFAHDSLKNGCRDHYEISHFYQMSSNLRF